jgi:C4-dicarboxylate-specific signal transduction histidine kinase
VPNPVHEASAVTAEWAWSAPKHPARNREPRCHETQAGLASANRVAIPEQLSAPIAEINQPISAIVMNAEAALQLLLAQPTDAEAVRRLLACIIKDGMRTGDIVNRTCALIKKSAVTMNS